MQLHEDPQETEYEKNQADIEPDSRPRMRKRSTWTGVESCKIPRRVDSNQRLVSSYLSVHLALVFFLRLRLAQIILC